VPRFEPEEAAVLFRPLRPLITSSFDKENQRTMVAVRPYAEAHARDGAS
jgi:hypothetical protein